MVAVSTMIVLAYRQQGHGVSMNTAWSRAAWIIAAILYVDDTDLLHRRGRQDLTRTDFVLRVNKATYLWALLLQATGGNLKPVKCYYYLLIFKFVKGQPRLLRLSELERLPKLYIPQPDAADVAIELKDCHVASETLGVYTAPSNRSNDQLDKMLSKAYDWADRVVSSTLMPGEVWKSFTTQIMPSLRYALVPLLTAPDVLEGSFMKFYTVFLPKLKVNRHIREDWKWLPWKYQGLGLPNMGIEKLGESLSYLLRNWGSETGVGLQLRDTYELVQLELGLEGNFLVRNYNVFHSLVSLSWFKTLWQYLYYYKVKVDICDVEIPAYRERDVVFMEIVVSQLDRSVWESINRVRRFKKVYFLSQLLSGDGVSVLPSMLTEEEGQENMMDFPREEPTKTDFEVWRTAIKSITSSTLTWQLRLGEALRRPYDRLIWITSSAQMDDLYSFDQISGEWKRYDLDSSRRVTRRGRHWSGGRVVVDPHIMRPYFVTVSLEDKELYSHTAVRQSLDRSDMSGLTVKEILDTLPNQSLWKDLEIGDGEWIREGIRRGNIVIVHDGSYMDELAPEVCSTAVVFFCKATGRLGHVTIAEMTDYKTASNYRGECLGGLLSGLVLEAATSDKEDTVTLPTIKIGCDNMGVVTHGNDLGRRLPEKQSQADVLRAMKTVFKRIKVNVVYEHVYGHQDEDIAFEDLPMIAQLNVIADKLAKERLLLAVSEQRFISNMGFPGETMQIRCSGQKVYASIKTELTEAWGRKLAAELFSERNILTEDLFHIVNWSAIEEASKHVSQAYRIWLCKHVAHFSGTNNHLTKIGYQVDHACPCCGEENETVEHLTKCKDGDRTRMFEETVYDLVEWLEATHTPEDICLAILDYLLARGQRSMRSLLVNREEYGDFAREHDRLGWRNFTEGRIATTLFVIQRDSLMEAGSAMRLRTWSRLLVQRLWNIIHRQWIYRNAKVHLKKLEDRPIGEHMRIIEEVRKMMLIEPKDLLPQHQRLLERDFLKLGEGTTETRLHWLNEMESAIKAKRAVAGVDSDLNREEVQQRKRISRWNKRSGRYRPLLGATAPVPKGT